MIPVNTCKMAPKKEKEQIKQSTDPAQKTQIEQDNMSTWISPNGQQSQIGYVAINHTYRNVVAKEGAMQGWRGNMAQQRQHAAIKMEITFRLVKNYHKKPPKETGGYQI